MNLDPPFEVLVQLDLRQALLQGIKLLPEQFAQLVREFGNAAPF